MIIKYFDYYKLKEFHVDETNYSSIKEIVHKLWKLVLEYSAEPQYNKFWIFDDSNNYIAVVSTIEGKLNFIKNQNFATPKDIISQSGFNIKWDTLWRDRIIWCVLTDWKYEYYKKYGYAKNYDLDINLFQKAYKKLVTQDKKIDSLYLLDDSKFWNLSETEQSELKHKFSNLFRANIGDWESKKFITFKHFNIKNNAEHYFENYGITEDNFYLDDSKCFSLKCELENENRELYQNIKQAIKSDKDIVDNLLAHGMVQLQEDTICFREFGMHSNRLKNENYNGFVSASLNNRLGSYLGKTYDYERCEPFILPKSFWYVPNKAIKNDRLIIESEPLEPGEILIWNPNLCKL